MASPPPSFSSLVNDEDESRYTLSGTGDAVEFGGFGGLGDPLEDHDPELRPGEWFMRELRKQREENEKPRRVARPSKNVPARLAVLRRRLAVDIEAGARS